MKFMNKKIFGIKIASYLQALVCLVVALCIWLFANYDMREEAPTTEETAAICECFEQV